MAPPRMEPDRFRLINSILHFLRGEYSAGYLNAENAEGLEVAIQCLETIYQLSHTTQTEPSLIDIYTTYLNTSVLNKPDASDDDKTEAERLKGEGNKAMTANRFCDAIQFYTKAIFHNAKNAVYYCNRAAAHSKLQNHNQAIVDCKIAIEIDPSYSKAYGRLGLAYCGLEDYFSALHYYKKALALEPWNDGYRKNYELALVKVNDHRVSSSNNNADSPSTITKQDTHNSNEAPGDGAGGIGSGGSGGTSGGTANPPPPPPPPDCNAIDFTALFENPQLLGFANQMLADPNMISIMASVLNASIGTAPTAAPEGNGGERGERAERPERGGGSADRGVNELFAVGQRLAQQMQAEHPTMIEELRQAFDRESRQHSSSDASAPKPDKKDTGDKKQ